ncbi:MAG TPA: hypothetical protein VGP08_09645 [Pyrinomonadaceae bacterium]|nr:hypothetical protein [Pyrinomonadaceae bacterium]
MNVNLNIERLVLEGFRLRPGEHLLVRAAVERELSRLLSERGVSPQLLSGGALPRLAAVDMRLNGGESPRQVGTQIARALYGGIGK